MKKIYFLILLILSGLGVAGRTLQFGKDGTFKIVQFTDTHFVYGTPASDTATATIRDILEIEKPDFVIITGDLVFASPVAKALPELVEPLAKAGVPWAAVLGNHDGQFDKTRDEVYNLLQAQAGSVMPPRSPRESPDYTLEVRSSHDPMKVAQVLYCMDTHDGPQVKNLGDYAWITQDQIAWYKDASNEYKRLNKGHKVPGIVFTHIPCPEFDYAVRNKATCGMVGTMGERVCCPDLNSGMFTALKEQGDVSAWFCGHDHDDDYVVDYYGILLGYGRYSGGKTVYNNLGTPGARVIITHEGKPDIETYVRLRDGAKLYPVTHQ